MPPPAPVSQFAVSQFAVCQFAVCQFEDGCGPACIGRPGFRWLLLQRHGLRPLAVLGRTLLHGDNRCAGLPWWSAVTLHETDAGRFAVSLLHAAADATAGNGDAAEAWHDAQLHDSAPALRRALGRHDPLHAWPVGAMAPDRDGRWQPPDIAAAWRFRAAWSGLLCVLFGLHPHKTGLESGAAE